MRVEQACVHVFAPTDLVLVGLSVGRYSSNKRKYTIS